MKRLLLLIALVAGVWIWQHPPGPAHVTIDASSSGLDAPLAQSKPEASGLADFLPAEAQHTLDLIRRGGPYPYRQDGSVFENREGRLPRAARGTYREYTVRTPGARDRGARRIITAGSPPSAYWYTDDHYRSFRRFEVAP